jgi:DnaJ family protein C protein 9
VLIDPEKRKLYDETGCLDEEGVLSEEKFESLYEYYKKQFKEVTTDAIDEFKESYQHSEEEMNDVLGYYEEFEGNMQKVFDHVMLSDPDEDAERFQKYVDDGLKDGRLSYCYDAYTQWKEKCSKKKSTRKKTLSRKKTKKGGDEQSLEQMILARRQEHSGLGNFAKRFGCDLMADDPLGSEEEFQKARARLDDARAKKTKR